MVTLTRIVSALYVGGTAAAAYVWGWDDVVRVSGPITLAASFLANILKDGTVLDALVNGLAINVMPGKTTAGK